MVDGPSLVDRAIPGPDFKGQVGIAHEDDLVALVIGIKVPGHFKAEFFPKCDRLWQIIGWHADVL